MTRIQERLFALQDTAYRGFQSRLIPTVSKGKIIGVRTPALRSLAKEIFRSGCYSDFLSALPHDYFEENQLHAFVISLLTDFDGCAAEVARFLPFVDNWATSDQLIPKVFKKHSAALLPLIRVWIRSPHAYTVRFAVGFLMQHFLDEDFSPEYAEMVAGVDSNEYYVNMMVAWYFATALSKQYDAALPFLAEHRLSVWVHNKTIQKACESYRIPDGRKMVLRGMRRKAE